MFRAASVLLLLLPVCLCSLPTTNLWKLFTSVSNEVPEEVSVQVNGTIPAWVDGTLYRNGFGKFEGDSGFTFNYLFDVMSLLVKFRIQNGAVYFQSRLLHGSYFNDSSSHIPYYRTFGGTDPCQSIFGKAATLFHITHDNLNVNVVKIGSRLMAVSDLAGSVVIDENSLQTVGLYRYKDQLDGYFDMITSAHPSTLPGSPLIYNYKTEVFGAFPNITAINKYKIFTLDPTQPEPFQRNVLLEIPVSEIPYVHSFALTEDYLVFVEFPLFWDVSKIVFSMEILPAMEWKPEKRTRILVVDIKKRQIVRTLYTDPFFAYHHINAFQTGTGDIVFDICAYDDNSHMQAFKLSTLRNNSWPIPTGQLRRYQISMSGPESDAVKWSVVGSTSFDLPRINEARRAQKYQFVYGIGDYAPGDWWNTIVKVNVETGETLSWFKEHHWPSEPIFLPNPFGVDEDDGVVMSVVMAGDQDYSYLLVLDAKTMQPIATAATPLRLPFTSHGFFNVGPF